MRTRFSKGLVRKLAASAAAVLAVSWMAPGLPAAAASGGTVVASLYFDSKVYDYLLDSADVNGDGKLNEYELSLVTEADVSGLGLTSLKGFSRLPNLSWLNASDNSLKSLTSLGRCSNLLYLDVSGNKLTGLSGVSGLSSLVELNASGNAITSVSALSNLENLESLDLSNNSIKAATALGNL